MRVELTCSKDFRYSETIQIRIKRYDVMLEPIDKCGKAFIFEFKVLEDSDEDEETLEDTLAAAHRQIAEKKYESELVSRGFLPEKIRKYGVAFQGKECLIG